MTQAMSESQRQVCAFSLGDQLFGIDVGYIQEVFRFQECTPVPLTPSLVTGLLNLRGQIVLAIDLRQRFGIPPRSSDTSPTSIVVRMDEGVLSFLVDELFDIMTLEQTQFEAIPETLTEVEKQFVTGCYKLQDRLLIMLDAEQVGDISGTLRATLDAVKAKRETHAKVSGQG